MNINIEDLGIVAVIALDDAIIGYKVVSSDPVKGIAKVALRLVKSKDLELSRRAFIKAFRSDGWQETRPGVLQEDLKFLYSKESEGRELKDLEFKKADGNLSITNQTPSLIDKLVSNRLTNKGISVLPELYNTQK